MPDQRAAAKHISFTSGPSTRLSLSDVEKEQIREITWRVTKTFYQTILKQPPLTVIDTRPSRPATCWARLGRPALFDPEEE